MTAVFRHEVRLLFSGLTAYVYGAFIIMIPILTMRTISEERKQKTDQLLYSLPISATQIVLGKFLAVFLASPLPMCAVVFYPLVLKDYGSLYLPTAYGTMFRYVMTAAVLLSIGMFISSITESQAMAAGICFAAMLLNYYMVTVAEYAISSAYGSLIAIVVLEVILSLLMRHMTGNEVLSQGLGIVSIVATTVLYFYRSEWFEGLFPTILENISVYERFYQFVDGIFDYTNVVYFVSVIIFFLFLTVQSLEKRRYN